jgi:hypothetical protein
METPISPPHDGKVKVRRKKDKVDTAQALIVLE